MKEVFNPTKYDMPKPTRFVILDNLSRGNTKVRRRLQQLREFVDAPFEAMLVDIAVLAQRLKSRYEVQIQKGQLNPVDLVVTVGSAGEQVAGFLDIGSIQIRLNPTRKAGDDGLPFITSKTGVSLDKEAKRALAAFPEDVCSSSKTIGLVDDVVFFGSTTREVVKVLEPIFPRSDFIVLALTYVAPFAGDLSEKVKVVSGLTITTSQDVQSGLNCINAKDFVVDDALYLADGTTIAFIQEENWMRAWFGKNYDQAIDVCRQIRRYL